MALWLGFKNSGQLIGGAINLGLNAKRNKAGKVSYITILVFVALQVLAFPMSFLLSPPHKTQRSDGTTIGVEKRTSMKEQFHRLWKTLTSRQTGLLLPIFFASWFYWVRETGHYVHRTVADQICRAMHRHTSHCTSRFAHEH